jgi:phage shock protein C
MNNSTPSAFRKDKDNKLIFGVCAGFARKFGWDALWLRLGLVALTLFGFGMPLILYLLVAFIAD